MAEADVFLPCNMDHISDQATFQRYESSVASALKANTPWQMSLVSQSCMDEAARDQLFAA